MCIALIWKVLKSYDSFSVAYLPLSPHTLAAGLSHIRSTPHPLSVRWSGMMGKMTRESWVVCRYVKMTDGFGATLRQLQGLCRAGACLTEGMFLGVGCLSGQTSPDNCHLASYQGRQPVTHHCTLWLHIWVFSAHNGPLHNSSLWLWIKSQWRHKKKNQIAKTVTHAVVCFACDLSV